MSKQRPIIRRGGLTGRVYLVTRYTDDGNGNLTALAKVDITDEYEAQRAEDSRDRRKIVRPAAKGDYRTEVDGA